MAPKKKPVAEIGGAQVRNGRFRARVHACAGHQHGPTRSTEEEALAGLNAARNGATDKEDVARHLAELAAAASCLTAARPVAEQSHARGHASADDQQNDYPALFPNPSADLLQAMRLARAAPDAETTAALKRACAEWNVALANGTHASKQKRRKLCSDHAILSYQDVDIKTQKQQRAWSAVCSLRDCRHCCSSNLCWISTSS